MLFLDNISHLFLGVVRANVAFLYCLIELLMKKSGVKLHEFCRVICNYPLMID